MCIVVIKWASASVNRFFPRPLSSQRAHMSSYQQQCEFGVTSVENSSEDGLPDINALSIDSTSGDVEWPRKVLD